MNDIPARDIMTTKVISVNRNSPLKEITRLLSKYFVSGLPVVDDDGIVVGIISEKDVLKYTRWVIGHPLKDPLQVLEADEEPSSVGSQRTHDLIQSVMSVKAEAVMTDEIITATEETTLLAIVRLMNKHDINRVPIVDEAGTLKGIIARADILHILEKNADES